ncbi:hypothetical protein ARMGADRAFT_639858 [Armillaria gallica]|uniref:Protein kinase domain-containing protein n=1 Tax=Armillaria gallica TaxID=47427 RepID=A0A2H3DUC3_ARMGA|nr:hypothetical protein ARMGADRAFT_639858 [Armillaria gallica]
MYSRRHLDVMENELKAYEYIYRHQLYDITLTYYGMFAMPDQSWGAIILADGGESPECFMDGNWKDAGLGPNVLYVSAHPLRVFSPNMYRITIWNHVKALHAIGMVHHDLVLRNITRDKNGVLRTIDFESASYDHTLSESCSTPCLELVSLGGKFDSLAGAAGAMCLVCSYPRK